MPKIEKMKSGRYRILINLGYINGKQVRKSITGSTKKEVKMKALEYQAMHKSPTLETIGTAIEDFIRSKTEFLSPSTIRGYRNIQRRLVKDYPKFCDTCLDAVTDTKVEALLRDLTAAGLSSKTVRNYYGLISAVMKYKKAYLAPVTLPAKSRTEITVPDDAAVKNIFQAVKGTELEVPVLLAAIGGLRRGEICALTLDDFDGNTVHVNKDMVMGPDRKWIIKQRPKTYGSDRYVQLPEAVVSLIREKGYVTKVTPHSLTDMHRRFLQAHDFPAFRFHDYRHYMVSSLHAIMVPDSYIMQRGGWTSDHVMKTVYRHTLADQDRNMVQLANEHFGAML